MRRYYVLIELIQRVACILMTALALALAQTRHKDAGEEF